jgi:hypothetical protein
MSTSCKRDSFYGKYNAQEYGKYSSIDFISDNLLRLNCNNQNVSYLVKYEKRGKYIFAKFEDRYEGFEIIDNTVIEGKNEIFENKNVFYKKNFINTDKNDNQLIAIISKKLTDSLIFEYLSSGEIIAKSKNQNRVIISIKLGISIENIVSVKKELSLKMSAIKKCIREYINTQSNGELSNENEEEMRFELSNEINKKMSRRIVKDVIVEKMFIEF